MRTLATMGRPITEWAFNCYDLAKITSRAADDIQGGKPLAKWTFNYGDLAEIANKGVNAIQVSRRRPGGFDPENLESVLLWCARNARPDLKMEILRHATHMSRSRLGGFDPDSLESVILWCARNARPGLKDEILRHASSISIVVDAKERRRRRPTS